MNPADFVPIYDETVLESLGDNAWPIQGKGYCLTMASSLVLASFWDPAPKVVMKPPIQQAPASPFQFNHYVPWLQFSETTIRNAGALATYWGMPGVPLDKALDYAKIDVATEVQG